MSVESVFRSDWTHQGMLPPRDKYERTPTEPCATSASPTSSQNCIPQPLLDSAHHGCFFDQYQNPFTYSEESFEWKRLDSPQLTAAVKFEATNEDLNSGLIDYPFVCPQDLELRGNGFEDNYASATSKNEAASESSDPPYPDNSSRLLHAQHKSAGYVSSSPSRSAHRGSKKNIEPVKVWLMKHASSPYPSEAQIQDLAEATGLSLHQVRVCLSNLRARMKNTHKSRNAAVPAVDFHNFIDSTDTTGSYPLVSDLDSWLSVPLDSPVASSSLVALPTGYLSQAQAAFPTVKAESDCPPAFTSLGSNSLDHNQSGTIETFSHRISEPSIGKVHKRKGKRQYAFDHGLDDKQLTGLPTSDKSNDGAHNEKAFHCTAPGCRKTFKDVYGWKRHEIGVHDYRITEWTCMLDGQFLRDGGDCAFCGAGFDPDHFDQHSTFVCFNKDAVERTFARKDLLKQHVLQVHLATADKGTRKAFKVPGSWSKIVDASQLDPASLWCGFCSISLESTTERMDHVANHFRHGHDMSSWQHPTLT